MKIYTLLLILLAFPFGQTEAQNSKKTVPLRGDYHKMEISGLLDVEVVFNSDKSEAMLDIPLDYADKVHATVRNGTVFLEMDEIRSKKINKKAIGQVVIHIDKEITEFTSMIVGKLTFMSPLRTRAVDIDIASVGKADIDLEVARADIEIEMVGNTEIRGSAARAKIESSGVGNIRATNFRVGDLTVENEGVGNVEVYASQRISLENSGIGNVRYGGDAKVVKLESSGIGNVRKINR